MAETHNQYIPVVIKSIGFFGVSRGRSVLKIFFRVNSFQIDKTPTFQTSGDFFELYCSLQHFFFHTSRFQSLINYIKKLSIS